MNAVNNDSPQYLNAKLSVKGEELEKIIMQEHTKLKLKLNVKREFNKKESLKLDEMQEESTTLTYKSAILSSELSQLKIKISQLENEVQESMCKIDEIIPKKMIATMVQEKEKQSLQLYYESMEKRKQFIAEFWKTFATSSDNQELQKKKTKLIERQEALKDQISRMKEKCTSSAISKLTEECMVLRMLRGCMPLLSNSWNPIWMRLIPRKNLILTQEKPENGIQTQSRTLLIPRMHKSAHSWSRKKYPCFHNKAKNLPGVVDISSQRSFFPAAEKTIENGPYKTKETTDKDKLLTSHDKYTLYCRTDCCWTFDNEAKQFLTEMNLSSLNDRKSTMMNQHPELKPSDRACLLDWLMEVSEFYKLSRDSYYQCLDYIDRFFTASRDICREHIQLIGVTCLHLANKQEDSHIIRLPKLLFLADDLFTSEDVLIMERQVLEAIGWRCSIWNVNKWLFMLLHVAKRSLSVQELLQITDLLDLITLDIKSLDYSYSVLASSCLYLVTSVSVQFPDDFNANGNIQICRCVSWMRDYWYEINCKYTAGQPDSVSSLNHNCKLLSVSVYQNYANVYQTYRKIQTQKQIFTKRNSTKRSLNEKEA